MDMTRTHLDEVAEATQDENNAVDTMGWTRAIVRVHKLDGVLTVTHCCPHCNCEIMSCECQDGNGAVGRDFVTSPVEIEEGI